MTATDPAATLLQELDWLEQSLARRLALHVNPDMADTPEVAMPVLERGCVYGEALHGAGLAEDAVARLILITALAPWLRPTLLDPLFIRHAAIDRPFTEFGGIVDRPGGGFRPTRQTALFLAAGDDLASRIAAMPRFAASAPLCRHRLIARHGDDPAPWQPLDPHRKLVARLLGG